jgi:O-antigen/teichoic acid export membrane protein
MSSLTAKGFLKKLIGFSMASWLSAAISFLMTPILTRLYIPDDIGHINLFTTYMTFFQTVSVLALDQAFMRFYNESLEGLTKQNFLRYCLKINLSIAAVNAVIVLGGYRFFSKQIAQEESLWIPVCLVLVIISSTVLRMCSVSSRMEKSVLNYTLQIVLATVVEKVVITLVAFYDPDYRLAIIAMTLGYVILSATILLLKRKRSLWPAVHVPWETTSIILRFSIPYLPVLLLSWLNSSIPLIVLKSHVDYAAVGIYTNAVTIANILHLVQTGFSAYWAPFIYEHYQDEKNKEKIQKIQRLIVVVLIFISLCIVLFQDIIYLLVGEEFRSSKTFFPLLMLTPICNTIADMTGIGIMLSRKSYLNIFTFLGSTSVNLILSYLLVPRIGVLGAGIAVGASALTMLTIRSILGGKYYKISQNYWFIVFALAVMLLASLVNMLASESIWLKSVMLVILMGIFCAGFFRDIVLVWKFVLQEGKSLLGRFSKSNSK